LPEIDKRFKSDYDQYDNAISNVKNIRNNPKIKKKKMNLDALVRKRNHEFFQEINEIEVR
jgi:hypothetical protein